ncbi:TIGR01777 family oxidoreductase [Sulfurospirillum arcachonense]|uniref:TIGR01777 family oxidoreductase n=1 Tax=Sulfurospirillum arcachonense TaxID=57666 RepID=UPI00046858B6|nr:TIGR01777 family oxidoreductase [Sulfurospirillum arcachonense]
MQTVAITGASGFVGSSLKQMFEKQNFKVLSIKRDELQNLEKLTTIINESDILINLAGASIINRWSEEYKKILYSSRIETTKYLLDAITQSQNRPKYFISTSAIGIYKNNDTYDEDSLDLENDFLANLCKEWEEIALEAKMYGVKTSIFRFGIVMGKGGALAKMLLPFKLGIGGTIASGKQAFSFIHIEDLMRAYKFVIEQELEGVFNLCAPTSTTNEGLTRTLGKKLHRPTFFPIPEFVLKLLFGEGSKVLCDGQRVIPKRLIENGFEFKYENIDQTIQDLV